MGTQFVPLIIHYFICEPAEFMCPEYLEKQTVGDMQMSPLISMDIIIFSLIIILVCGILYIRPNKMNNGRLTVVRVA